MGRMGGRVRAGLVLAVAASVLLGALTPNAARAQDGKQPLTLSWDDAPLVPRHRSAADWLIDVGWKTYDEVYGPFPTREYQVGDTEQFVPLIAAAGERSVYTLRFRSEHAYFWFDRAAHPSATALEATTRFFEEHIWPLNHRIYGDEWTPGIDGDSRIHIINQSAIAPGILGAFNPDDQCPRSLCPSSNQREIIYINLEAAPLGSDEYLTTLAHEHQHLIQFHVDGNERRWFNEALSQLAEHLNGFDPRFIGDVSVVDFLAEPDHPLRGWTSDPAELSSYYGAGYLFMVYLYERFGLDFIRLMASSDYDGLASVQHALAASGRGVTVDEVFADWALANLLDDPYAGDGRFYYQGLDLPERIQPLPLDLRSGVGARADTVNQYGADYLSIDQPGRYTLTFDGSDAAPVMGAQPHSGEWMWWSYDDSSSAARLTAAFDLAGLTRATLAFSAWWQVEDNYDWLQVLVSDNGGQDWVIVEGAKAARDGLLAPGAHYSGHSSAWVDERIDLGAYAGSAILVRFEYLTDASETWQGVALDDLGIIEMRQIDDVESPASAWVPAGFLRIPASVVQNWALRLVLYAPDGGADVLPVALDAQHTGRASFEVMPGGSAAVVIAAMAPFATEPASYKLVAQHTP